MQASDGQSGQGVQTGRPGRRALDFWRPLNAWWRDFVAAHQRRPNTSEITRWHAENAARHWGVDAPTAKAAKQHANCLRPVEQVKAYFRNYRKRKATGGAEGYDELPELGEAVHAPKRHPGHERSPQEPIPGSPGALHAPGPAPGLGGYHGAHAGPGSWTGATHFSAAPVLAQQQQQQQQQSAQMAALAPISDLSRSAIHSSHQAAAFAASAPCAATRVSAATALPTDRQPSRPLLYKQQAREDGSTWRDMASMHPADAAAACGKYPLAQDSGGQAEGGFSSNSRATQFGLDAVHAKAPGVVTQGAAADARGAHRTSAGSSSTVATERRPTPDQHQRFSLDPHQQAEPDLHRQPSPKLHQRPASNLHRQPAADLHPRLHLHPYTAVKLEVPDAHHVRHAIDAQRADHAYHHGTTSDRALAAPLREGDARPHSSSQPSSTAATCFPNATAFPGATASAAGTTFPGVTATATAFPDASASAAATASPVATASAAANARTGVRQHRASFTTGSTAGQARDSGCGAADPHTSTPCHNSMDPRHTPTNDPRGHTSAAASSSSDLTEGSRREAAVWVDAAARQRSTSRPDDCRTPTPAHEAAAAAVAMAASTLAAAATGVDLRRQQQQQRRQEDEHEEEEEERCKSRVRRERKSSHGYTRGSFPAPGAAAQEGDCACEAALKLSPGIVPRPGSGGMWMRGAGAEEAEEVDEGEERFSSRVRRERKSSHGYTRGGAAPQEGDYACEAALKLSPGIVPRPESGGTWVLGAEAEEAEAAAAAAAIAAMRGDPAAAAAGAAMEATEEAEEAAAETAEEVEEDYYIGGAAAVGGDASEAAAAKRVLRRLSAILDAQAADGRRPRTAGHAGHGASGLLGHAGHHNAAGEEGEAAGGEGRGQVLTLLRIDGAAAAPHTLSPEDASAWQHQQQQEQQQGTHQQQQEQQQRQRPHQHQHQHRQRPHQQHQHQQQQRPHQQHQHQQEGLALGGIDGGDGASAALPLPTASQGALLLPLTRHQLEALRALTGGGTNAPSLNAAQVQQLQLRLQGGRDGSGGSPLQSGAAQQLQLRLQGGGRDGHGPDAHGGSPLQGATLQQLQLRLHGGMEGRNGSPLQHATPQQLQQLGGDRASLLSLAAAGGHAPLSLPLSYHLGSLTGGGALLASTASALNLTGVGLGGAVWGGTGLNYATSGNAGLDYASLGNAGLAASGLLMPAIGGTALCGTGAAGVSDAALASALFGGTGLRAGLGGGTGLGAGGGLVNALAMHSHGLPPQGGMDFTGGQGGLSLANTQLLANQSASPLLRQLLTRVAAGSGSELYSTGVLGTGGGAHVPGSNPAGLHFSAADLHASALFNAGLPAAGLPGVGLSGTGLPGVGLSGTGLSGAASNAGLPSQPLFVAYQLSSRGQGQSPVPTPTEGAARQLVLLQSL